MALLAFPLPILPGKTQEWRDFIEEVNGPRYEEFTASRRAAGVHERTFLQQTPMGDLVIVTVEGDDPARSFAQLMTGTDEFSTWFGEHAMAVHAHFTAPPVGPPSDLVADSGRP